MGDELNALADEFDAAPDDAGWDEGHPIFQLAAENDSLRAENARLREMVAGIDCSCLPFADIHPENECARCRALTPLQEVKQ